MNCLKLKVYIYVTMHVFAQNFHKIHYDILLAMYLFANSFLLKTYKTGDWKSICMCLLAHRHRVGSFWRGLTQKNETTPHHGYVLWSSALCNIGMGVTLPVSYPCSFSYFFSCDQAALWMVFSFRLSVRLSVCHTFLAATKQLNEWYFPSVRPSVCLSVCLLHLFDYVPMIVSSWNFQEFLPMTDGTSIKWSRSEVKGQGHRSQHPT